MSTPRTDQEVLEATLEIIQEEDTWCKGAWFRDEHGVDTANPFYATAYCLEGAIQVATLRYQHQNAEEILEQERRVKSKLVGILLSDQFGQCHPSIPSFNDDKATTKEDAILLVKYGIEKAYQDATE